MPPKLTREVLIAEIQELSRKKGRPLTTKDYSRFMTAIRLFGSWENFLNEAGLPMSPRKRYSDEFFFNLAWEYYRKTNKLPKTTHLSHVNTIISRFGTWNHFLLKAGFSSEEIEKRVKKPVAPTVELTNEEIEKPVKKLVVLTNEELYMKVRRSSKRRRRIPNPYEFPFTDQVKEHFRSWDDFLLFAGFTSDEISQYHDENEKYLTVIRKWVKEHGRIPSEDEWLKLGLSPSIYEIWEHFSSWRNYIKMAKEKQGPFFYKIFNYYP